MRRDWRTGGHLGDSVRLNITVPRDVAETLKELAGPREQSSLITKSVRFYVRRLKRQRLLAELREGYTAVSREGLELSEEFDSTLMDGLDDENR